MIARLSFPDSWRCVVAIPEAEQPSLSGAAEEAVFAALPQPSEREVEKMAHLVSTDRARLLAFGRAIDLPLERLQYKPLKDPRTGERREAWHWDLVRHVVPPLGDERHGDE